MPHVSRSECACGAAQSRSFSAADYHYALGKELQALRNKGVLIVGRGHIVHNLRTAVWREEAYDWADRV